MRVVIGRLATFMSCSTGGEVVFEGWLPTSAVGSGGRVAVDRAREREDDAHPAALREAGAVLGVVQ